MADTGRGFDWRLFADATAAGLATLVPLPLLDLALEGLFRRRIPRAICRARGVTPEPAALAAMGRGGPWLSARSCLTLPFAAALYLLKRLSRKLLYVLTVHEAANQLVLYWHRAWLIDHMARSGLLAAGRPVGPAHAALERSLAEVDTSALGHIGGQAIRGTRHVLRRLLHARRRGADDAFPAQRAFLADQWERIEVHLQAAVTRFDAIYLNQTAGAPPS